MSKQVPAQAYMGPLTADLSPLKAKLVDLPPGGMNLLRAERAGIDAVNAELSSIDPTLLTAAGVPQDVVVGFGERTASLAEIRDARTRIDKMAEVLRETEAKLEHERENDISVIAESVKTMARLKGQPALLAGYDNTLKYAAQTAKKAVKTRTKNAEPKREATEPTEPTG